MSKYKREYTKSSISEILKAEGSSSRKFANWLGMSEEGLSRKLKSCEEKGLDKGLESSIRIFVMEKRGITFKVDGI